MFSYNQRDRNGVATVCSEYTHYTRSRERHMHMQPLSRLRVCDWSQMHYHHVIVCIERLSWQSSSKPLGKNPDCYLLSILCLIQVCSAFVNLYAEPVFRHVPLEYCVWRQQSGRVKQACRESSASGYQNDARRHRTTACRLRLLNLITKHLDRSLFVRNFRLLWWALPH